MLEFTDASYQFFPAQPMSWFMSLMQQVNRFAILGNENHRVVERSIEGNIDQVKQLHRDGKRILFIVNHPSHSDPQLMYEVQRQLGIKSSYMAAYDVFLRSPLQAWIMQHTGCFSIDREGSDRKAMTEAINLLKGGDYALTIFPEGNVYLLNDRVTPFLDGTAFIGMKAHQALKDESEVYIVPVSLKFSQLEDIQEKVTDRLLELANQANFKGDIDRSNPRAVVSVACHLLASLLDEETKQEFNLDFNFADKKPEQIRDELHLLTQNLASKLENDLDIPSDPELFIVDRVRKIRSKIHQLKIEETDIPPFPEVQLNQLADRSILIFRILAYVLPYFQEKPTLDRYTEIVDRLNEDFHSHRFKPLGSRKGVAYINEPIAIADFLEKGKKAKQILPEMTAAMETAIQDGIDQINSQLDTPGSKLIGID